MTAMELKDITGPLTQRILSLPLPLASKLLPMRGVIQSTKLFEDIRDPHAHATVPSFQSQSLVSVEYGAPSGQVGFLLYRLSVFGSRL